MSTALTTAASALALWSAEELTVIKSVIAPDLTDAELRFFAQVCAATGLNPLMNQIVPIKRNDKNAPGGKKLTIQTTIHGLRLIADRTGHYAPGQRPTFEYKEDGKRLLSATAYVKKFAGGQWHDVEDTAYWDEYVQTYGSSGDPVALWKTKPHVMLAKCAEALALRRAFPAEMASLYTDDEMSQADAPPVYAAPVQSDTRRRLLDATKPMTADQVKSLVAKAVALGWEAPAVAKASLDIYSEPLEALTQGDATELWRALKGGLIEYDGDGRAFIAEPPAIEGGQS